MRFRVLDIETIPDGAVWTKGDNQYRLTQGLPVVDGNRYSGLHEAAVLPSDPFPPPHACRVVALSTVDIVMDIQQSPRYSFDSCATSCDWWDGVPRAGRSALGRIVSYEDFAEIELISKFSESMFESSATLVTWNGRGFDLPVLSMRALKLGVPFGWYYRSRDIRYRYSDEGHLDLMDSLGDYGASRNAKLGDVARLIGLPGKIGEVKGSGVHDIYLSTLGEQDTKIVRDRQDAVGRYCLQDTIQTALIFLRSRFHVGKIERNEYNLCLETFANSQDVGAAISIDWDRLRL
jgi:predicted PolB exonuclease-like 3'-5' exonuclease